MEQTENWKKNTIEKKEWYQTSKDYKHKQTRTRP